MSSKNVLTGAKTFFPEVEFVPFEGKDSDNPFAFKYYNPEQLISGKSMADHFRFAIAYWHSFCGNGADPFGMPTRNMAWLNASNPMDRAKDKMDAAFEFITKIQAPYFCFHDFDLIEEGHSLVESEKRLQFIGDYAKEKMAASGVKVLWGTANLFSHPRYMNGAATNPDFSVVAYAAAQVKHALDISIHLGAENYVFWGGREGYLSLLNTDMKREVAHLATFLHAAKDYARSQGFKGHFFIEPKPAEPTKHQYDYDSATVIGFLKANGLENDFKLNIEVNHATLALHTFQHELTVAAADNMIGSIDANRGDYQNGWDTDQFPNNLGELTEAMLVILQAGGFQGGGVNFDAKIRRNSTDNTDLFLAHIGGMDTFARALITADKIINKSAYVTLRNERYASFDAGEGALFEKGKLSLADWHNLAGSSADPVQKSGKQELFENILNQYI